MTPLAESAAIILGAATWPKYKEFDPHQSFRNSAEFFRDYLLENGLTNLLWLFDEPDQPAILIEKIGGFLKEERNQALRNVIFYYVGHGGHFERQYFVAPACTSKAALDLSILPVRYLADTLYREAPAQRHIVIIDACYAAGAVKDFIRQSATDVVKQVREVLRELDRSRGTSLFCAAGSLTEAKAPWQADFTMFSGALRNALTKGDPEAGPLLSLRQLAELVEAEIFAAFRGEAVRPEVHTPRQDRGDISTVELFPNPAFLNEPETKLSRRLKADLEVLQQTTRGLAAELEWERASRKLGWYELLELRKEIDQFGDLAQRHRLVGIHGPEDGEIASLPYAFRAMPELGTCVLDRITDEQRAWSLEGNKLPAPSAVLTGELVLNPPAAGPTPHKGFTVTSNLINSFAMTTRDAELRNHDCMEQTSISATYPARHLRFVVVFPSGYAPTETPQITAYRPTDVDRPIADWPEHATETARVAPGLFYDGSRECAILSVERALPCFHYMLRWKLPPQPDPDSEAAIRAREQVRDLLGLERQERARLDERLTEIRDVVCQQHLGVRKDRRKTVHVSLLVFDQNSTRTRIVASTLDSAARDVALPWGVGVVGWVMRRRRPAFVDTKDRGGAGIYRTVPGWPAERFVLCVPLPLPSSAAQRDENLRNPAIPCAVASLGCLDENGNMERLKEAGRLGSASSGDLMRRIADELMAMTLDAIAAAT